MRSFGRLAFLALVLVASTLRAAPSNDGVDALDVNWKKPSGGGQPSTSGSSTAPKNPPGGGQASTSGSSRPIKLKRPLSSSSSSSPSSSGPPPPKQPKRPPPPPPKNAINDAKGCICNGGTLSLVDVKNALTQGIGHLNDGTKVTMPSGAFYPEVYNNLDAATQRSAEVKFPDRRCTSLTDFKWAYPVLKGATFDATSPSQGAYRVVWTVANEFCGCIEHISKTNRGFTVCADPP